MRATGCLAECIIRYRYTQQSKLLKNQANEKQLEHEQERKRTFGSCYNASILQKELVFLNLFDHPRCHVPITFLDVCVCGRGGGGGEESK